MCSKHGEEVCEDDGRKADTSTNNQDVQDILTASINITHFFMHAEEPFSRGT